VTWHGSACKQDTMGQESAPSSKGGEGKYDGRIRPGEVRNPTGKGPWEYRRKYEAAFAKAVEEGTDTLVAVLMAMAKAGDKDMMRMVMERVMPRLDRHEIDAGAAPSKLVIEFSKPEPGKGGEGGDAG